MSLEIPNISNPSVRQFTASTPAISTAPRRICALVEGKSIRFATIQDKFNFLAEQWKSGRGPHSAVGRLAIHPAYQSIIGMGSEVVPLILAELERKPDHWFWALSAIAGEDPVPQASRGIVPEMVASWLAWGKENGYR